jgi:hypothetical protein
MVENLSHEMCVVTSIIPGLTLAKGCCSAPTESPPKLSLPQVGEGREMCVCVCVFKH